MRTFFFRKTAWSNITKNYRFFIPRIMAEIGLLGSFYIAVTLMTDKRLSGIRGGSYIPTLMGIGVAVLAVLSAVIMFYVNSFLMKQRKYELGLYNVLGMEKKHVCRVLFHETLISSVVSVVGGLLFGMLFYKLCSLLICRLLQAKVIFGFYFITPVSLTTSALYFILLDLASFIVNTVSIGKMNTVDLLSSRSVGEKEPKIKWVMLVAGILALGGGYCISIMTKNPLDALMLFFLAVILVIIGTYFLFVTGSTFVLKTLKRNRSYYYDKKHMSVVSGLLYRMKQNAVGLASIAILSTGVLVMISTTVALYSGMQDSLGSHYPQHLYVSAGYETKDGITGISPDILEEMVLKTAEKNGAKIKSIAEQRYLEVSYLLEGNELVSTVGNPEMPNLSNLCTAIFMTEKDYTASTGENLNLSEDEIAVCRIASSIKNVRELRGSLSVHGKGYRIKQVLNSYPIKTSLAEVSNGYGIVVADDGALDLICKAQNEEYGEHCSDYTERLAVTFENVDDVSENGTGLEKDLADLIAGYAGKDSSEQEYWFSIDSYWQAKDSLIGMYGTFLFLGILLGSVCMFATVLIIYYKQISEGYEDRSRFQIMQKIGMNGEEIKKTINTQVLTAFFLPLIVAGIHMAFAFPILERLLRILMLSATSLFVVSSVTVFAVFAVIYTVIYLSTARTYYKIVY